MSGGFVGPINEVELYINLAIAFVLLVLKIFAFVSALLYSGESYVAADKLTKPTWCAILGVGVLLQLVPLNLSIINLAMTVAALVYLADVRPALAGLRRR
ncbi:DUF2516 family protein [Nocardioides sp. zg-536]|uniref:DUF2516 family protein n=1 Tax=Nocardioides faecalis TaxID=2803858 RepID=A0A938Y702_9ACTN|nr:DUF2516 family protein [Nocardioides faecalis]MBM9458374.1 DUF2516 family protein [Nocardioides faecalis]MBS4753314.1 DUF2516 family protein [Nocardioides faecalis]QVI58394.1 DUF2516 family protein [Nocardioides faecalis]